MTHGVMTIGIRGISLWVTQKEFEPNKVQIESKGTAKTSLVLGHTECTNLIAYSVYNTNNVHHLSMVSKELKWFMKDKE